MPTPRITTTVAAGEDFDSLAEYVQYLAGILARNSKDLNWTLSGNLDVENIKAKSITADRMSVKELSAIAADLGTITAGTIIGALIKTALSGQRVELSSTDNLLQAINAAGQYIKILPTYVSGPAFEFNNGTGQLLIFMAGANFVMNSVGATNIQISSTAGDVLISCGTGKHVKVNNWSVFQNSDNGRTLQQELNDINTRLLAGGL